MEQIVRKCIQLRNQIEIKKGYWLLGCVVMGDFNLREGSKDLGIMKSID
jgi:hypothetical protein